MKEIITKTEHLILTDIGIIECKAFPNSYLNLEDAIENLNAVKALANGKKIPVLVDITETKGGSKECRDYYASEEAANIQSACAMLVESSLSKLIGNFFLGLNKTKFPLKLFSDKNEAIYWLQNFLNDE
ncbi:STAS/SEC14 domain-containing protein [Echinicola sp. 20G]|uniref:DUF7793 family protein n=1 Tax=Echinicola sp. 20G TaxID=2781961 RepID=UPI00190FE127|nr:STAS/SEC14 domain-containing protein [Echinicola sp. 20G]